MKKVVAIGPDGRRCLLAMMRIFCRALLVEEDFELSGR
jgi:hypothetical protein